MDILLRKDLANHRRRTICHARNDCNMLASVALYIAAHIFYKPRCITNKAVQSTERHYDSMGILLQQLRIWNELFTTGRFFPSKIQLPEHFLKVPTRQTETPFGLTGIGSLPSRCIKLL